MAAHLINSKKSDIIPLKDLLAGQVGIVVSQDPSYVFNYIGTLFLRTREGAQQIGETSFSINGENFMNLVMVRQLQPGEQIEM